MAQKSGLKIKTIKTVTPNLWTNIQIRRLTIEPKIGEGDYFWNGESKKTVNPSKNILKIFSMLEKYNFINRLIDFLGLGESFVVTMCLP